MRTETMNLQAINRTNCPASIMIGRAVYVLAARHLGLTGPRRLGLQTCPSLLRARDKGLRPDLFAQLPTQSNPEFKP